MALVSSLDERTVIEKTPEPKFHLGYVPSLDGLRGLAIGAVMLYHAQFSSFQGGLIGVDVFFILSAFLITTLLTSEHDSSHTIQLKNFYIRRFLRLAPALLTFLLVFILFSLTVVQGSGVRRNVEDALITLFYMSNWARAFNLHPPQFLGHTWSLSIEEQFYILWPLTFIGLLRLKLTRVTLIAVILGLALLSTAWRIYLTSTGTPLERVYNGLDTRADELLIGCALGVVIASGLRFTPGRLVTALRNILPFAALGSLVTLVYFSGNARLADRNLYYFHMSLIELCVTFIIIDIFFSKRSFLRPLLRFKPLVWIGRLSYAIYLWHYPIFLAMRHGKNTPDETLWFGGTLTLLFAVTSYFLIEQPALKLKRRFGAKQLLTISSAEAV